MSKPTIRTTIHKPQPSALERTYNLDVVRCFYCRSLLLITDDKAGSAVCSENCPSKLVKLDAKQLRLVRYAWRWKQQLDAANAAKAQETPA
jgi:hypothetical protein